MSKARYQAPVATPASAPLRALWRGEIDDEYGRMAVMKTAAAGLLVLQPELDLDAAQETAGELWQRRDRERLD